MKAKQITEKPDFKPVTLEVVFETNEELQFFKEFLGNLNGTSASEIAGLAYPEGDMLYKIYDAI